MKHFQLSYQLSSFAYESCAVYPTQRPQPYHFNFVNRAAYSKMAEELCSLLESTPGGESSSSLVVHMNCFETMLSAPVPEDLRSCHLQDALSVFTYLLAETTSWTTNSLLSPRFIVRTHRVLLFIIRQYIFVAAVILERECVCVSRYGVLPRSQEVHFYPFLIWEISIQYDFH